MYSASVVDNATGLVSAIATGWQAGPHRHCIGRHGHLGLLTRTCTFIGPLGVRVACDSAVAAVAAGV